MRVTEDLVPVPVRTPETERFWDAANEERLLYALCRTCQTPHYYPRQICPSCFSTDVDWPQSEGLGSIYAFSPFRRGRPPYVSAWVTLDEGVALLTNITDCESDDLSIGARVQVTFRLAEDGQRVPLFKPC